MNREPPRILVTRPEPDAEGTAARLEALGFAPVMSPLMDMQVLAAELPDASRAGGLVLTSANALRALEAQRRLAPFHGLTVYAVGDRTAQLAKDAGFAEVIAAEGELSSLVRILGEQAFAKPLFYPRGVHVSGDLAELLRPAGIAVIEAEVYGMTAREHLSADVIEQLRGGGITAAGFYSRRTAEIFCDLAADVVPAESKRRIAALCLSENVAAPLTAAGFGNIHLADFPSEEAMMALALSFVRHQIG